MEIEILAPAQNGKLDVLVTFSEEVDGLGHIANITVWVPASDSRKELEATARVAALQFLKRAISALDS